MASPPSSPPRSSPTPNQNDDISLPEFIYPPLSRYQPSQSLPPSSPLSSVPSSPAPIVEPDPITAASSDSVDPGVISTDPIVGSPATKRRLRREKSQTKRAATLAQKKAARAQEAAIAAEEAAKRKHRCFHEILEKLNKDGFTFGELLMYFLDPSTAGNIRWHQFLAAPGRLEQILDWFTSGGYPISVRESAQEWAIQTTCEIVGREATVVTNSGLLKTHKRHIDEGFIMSYNLRDYYDKLKNAGARNILRVYEAVTYSQRHPTFSNQRKLRGRVIVTSAVVACLGERNHFNNLPQRMMSMYLYSNGAQRQLITVLSRLGVCESYPTLTRNETVKPRRVGEGRVVAVKARKPSPNVVDGKRLGVLRNLSVSMREQARNLAQTGLMEEIFDNINFQSYVAEQKVGSHTTQENGTCQTIVNLWEAELDDLKTSKLIEAFLNAPLLSLSSILHNHDEQLLFRHCLIHDLVQVTIEFSGQEKLRSFRVLADQKQPHSEHKIKVHKTMVYPLPALNIDESTIKGNAEVDEARVKELKLDNIPQFWERARLVAGDQLSLARLRALQNIRAGQEGGYEALLSHILIPGIFHIKMADMTGVVPTHFGRIGNPSCIAHDNAVLNRLPITVTSLPSYRICRDIVFTSYYARVLHCFLLVSKKPTLKAYADSIESFKQLQDDAAKVYDQFANTNTVIKLRSERELRGRGYGDVVFENAVLFLRDALYSHELTRAVKAGDSGRIVLVLKIWALSFRGSGRTKYAYEMLHLIHNLTHVWPKEVVKIVLNNWLVNTTGRANRFLEVDLLQEHLNYWIKVFFKAHGSNMSWDWIEMIAPCVNILRHLANVMNETLGARQGSRHSSVDLQNDIGVLMKSLQENQVYEVQDGRTVDDDESQVFKDNVTAGLEALTTGNDNPLTEYNRNFHRLQKRRQMPPVETSGPTESAPLVQQQNSQPSSISTTASPSILHVHSSPPLPSTSEGPSQSLNLVSATTTANPDPQRPPLAAVQPDEDHEGDVEHDETVNELRVEQNELFGAESWEREPMFATTTESDVELDSGDSGDELGNEFGETDSEDEFE
ncbi:hypothetical protein PQX77_009900 [Marasmius sp. AFHP31]|nr:hypothetical protein PQX77_009900 [Marasmius sp. AFHP31]